MTLGKLRPTNGTVTVREALRLLWEADSYPRLGNEDNRVAAQLEQEALAKASRAVASPDDPAEFAGWLATFLDPSLPNHGRKATMSALYDLFDPEPNPLQRP